MYFQCLYGMLSLFLLYVWSTAAATSGLLPRVRRYGVFGGINSVMHSNGRLRTCCIPADRRLYSPNGLVQSQRNPLVE
ncbi:hypothetical protein GGI42DRAFT_332158 [Trichoderma sp. SZMC 28013]